MYAIRSYYAAPRPRDPTVDGGDVTGMAEFLHMGGYAPYVWSAYGAFALIVGGLTLAT